MQGTELKRLFLVVLIVSLCLTALLAIGITLFGSFDETVGQILTTIALMGAFSLVVLPAAALLDRQRAVSLAWVVITLAAAALLGALLLLWEIVDDSDGAWRAVGGITVLALGAAQIATMTSRLRSDDTPLSRRLYVASIATGVGFVTLVCVALAIEAEDETFYRVLGAVGVLNLLVVLLQPAMRRLAGTGRNARDAARGVAKPHSFRCEFDRLPAELPDPERYRATGTYAVVECRLPARDFAAAVETAIRELESTGARVARIERDRPAG